MTLCGWAYVCASVIGSSHAKNGTECQDRVACAELATPDGKPVFAAVVSDGAGSAARSAAGAEIVCALWIQEMRDLLDCGKTIQEFSRGAAQDWVMRAREAIALQADTEELPLRDFACTCLAMAAGEESAVFLQIGDGAIVAATGGSQDFAPVCWPQSGEYENTTYFVTDEGCLEALHYEHEERRIDAAALFSDGLQRLALQFETRTAHAPFFTAMFRPLVAEPAGPADSLSQALAAYLRSPRINERTDDDKSLILAMRAASESSAPHDEDRNDPADSDSL